MILNVILLLIGAFSLFFGIKTKLKMWIVIGLLLIGCGAVSCYVDITMGGGVDGAVNGRLPFVIDRMM